MSAQKFWGDYEGSVSPAHFAKVKSLHTGKEEHFAHRGQASHSSEYAEVSPAHFENHAKQAQEFVAATHPDRVKMIGGVPHVELYRGVHGTYAEKVLEKFGAHKYAPEPTQHTLDKKRVSVKHLPMSSWSMSEEVATDFASRGDSQHGIIFKKTFPLADVLHVGFGNWYSKEDGAHEAPPTAGQHYHEDEKEVVVRHPDEKLAISNNNIHAVRLPGSYGRYRIPVVADKNAPKVSEKTGKPGSPVGMKKSHPTPTFPKLGLGDDRRETPYVSNYTEIRSKAATINASNVRHPQNAHIDKPTLYNHFDNKAMKETVAAVNKVPKSAGKASNAETGIQSSYALAGEFAPDKNNNDASVRGTKLHEDLHMHMNRVHSKYGERGRQNLAENIYRAIPTQYRSAVDKHFKAKHGNSYAPDEEAEEKLANVLNYVNSSSERSAFHNAPEQLADESHIPQEFDTKMRRAYEAMRAAGGAADESWVTHQKMFKSEVDAHESASTHPCHGIATILHSSHSREEKLLALKHRHVTPWELKIALHDEDPEVREAALNHPNADLSVVSYGAEDLNKNIPPLLFPKLGEGRIHTGPMLMDDRAFKASASKASQNNLGYTRASVNATEGMPGERRKLSAAVNTDKFKQVDPVARGKAIAGAEGHETQHLVFRRLDQRFGRNNATPKVLNHLYNSLDNTDKHAIATMFVSANANKAYDKTKFAEEAIAHMQQYLQDPKFRASAHANANLDQLGGRDLHTKVKVAYKKLHQTASQLTPEHLGIVAKSDTDLLAEFATKLIKHRKEINENIIAEILGADLELSHYIKSAEFLTGQCLDENAIRDLMCSEDLTALESVAKVSGLDTKEGTEALMGVAGLETITKSNKEPNVKAFKESGEEFADAIRAAFASDNVKPIKLQGKHSSGALLAKDDDGNNLLMKPGSGKLSPAAGISQETATQSRREATFYAVAEFMGLGEYLVRTESVSVDGQEYAVMDMLPQDYRSFLSALKNNAGLDRRVFEPLRLDGTLAKWAALDWVCGNSDRHGQNIMVAPADDGGYDIKLIDHGSTFAGSDFSPSSTNSYVPYYLRYSAPKGKFNELSFEAKLKYLAAPPDDLLLAFSRWIEGVDATTLAALIASFGLNAQPAMNRLEQIKTASRIDWNAVLSLWIPPLLS